MAISAIPWNGDRITQEIHAFMAARIERAAKYTAGYIRLAVSIQGSVVPFVASRPYDYPYKWDPTLMDSIIAGPGDHPLQWVVVSDAVDMHLNIGHHYSADEEFGHWWDGWAWDFQTGKIVKVAEPHQVAPRPFMRRGLSECRQAIMDIITGGG